MRSENEIEVNDELIVRYLTGEATPEEAMALNDWREDSENEFYFKKMSATWNTMHPLKKERPVKKENAWEKLSKNVVTDKSEQKRFFLVNRLGFRIAASLAFVIFSGLVIYLRIDKNETQNILTIDYQKHVILSDSSKVTLYHNTSITFLEKFKDDFREVKLIKGEAFFLIARDKLKPFIIHTAFADIKLVGTEFN